MYRTQDLGIDNSAYGGMPPGLTSIMRSLSPSVLGNRTTQTQMPRTPQLPEITSGLGGIAKMLFGRQGATDIISGPLSLLGGM